jgi:hypothetical protein
MLDVRNEARLAAEYGAMADTIVTQAADHFSGIDMSRDGIQRSGDFRIRVGSTAFEPADSAGPAYIFRMARAYKGRERRPRATVVLPPGVSVEDGVIRKDIPGVFSVCKSGRGGGSGWEMEVKRAMDSKTPPTVQCRRI